MSAFQPWSGSHFKNDIRPAKLEKQDRTRRRLASDDKESDKVKARSQGQCEVRLLIRHPRKGEWTGTSEYRCQKRALHVHHMIGGWGKRARGKSILAEHKQHVCDKCHGDITGHILRRLGDQVPFWTDCYELAE